MSEINKIDLSRFVIDEKDIARSSIDVHSEVVKNAVERVAHLNEKTVEQALIVKQQEAIEGLKEQKSQLLAKLGAIGVLMKDVRYDEAIALLPPNCEQVVREIQAEAVLSAMHYADKDTSTKDAWIGRVHQYWQQLRNPEQDDSKNWVNHEPLRNEVYTLKLNQEHRERVRLEDKKFQERLDWWIDNKEKV